MMGLTNQQRHALNFLQDYVEVNGIAPTFDEIAAAVGLASKSGVKRLMDGLVVRGAIRRMANRPRAIEILQTGNPLRSVSDAALLAEVERRGL